MLTLPEAAIFTGKSYSTIYRYFKKGKFQVKITESQGKSVVKIEKEELVRVFGLNGSQVEVTESHGESQMEVTESHMKVTESQIVDIVKKTVTEQHNQLMKPMEELAIYRVGELTNEIKHLSAEKEALIEENNTLRKHLKALPGPVDEIVATITLLEQEKETLLREKETAIQQTTEALQKSQAEKNTVLQEKAAIQNEKEQTVEELQKKEQTIQQIEKEKAELQSEKERELAAMQQKIEAQEKEEKDYLATIEEMKKRLEEAEKPWWRKIFG